MALRARKVFGAFEKRSPSILVPRPRRLRDEKRAMGTRMRFAPFRIGGRRKNMPRVYLTKITRGSAGANFIHSCVRHPCVTTE